MPTKKTPSPPPVAKVALYDKLLAHFPQVERKGASMPYTALNGNMFSFLGAEGRMGLRLPTEEREAFLKKFKTKLYVAHGVVLKEYVTVPDKLLVKTSELKPYFALSLAYAEGLKAKATTKKFSSSRTSGKAAKKG